MTATTTRPTGTLPGMGKKKPAAARYKTPRINVGIPEPWHAVARKLAAKKKTPVLYLILALLQESAEKEGITDLPTPPWEIDDES